MTDQCAWPVGLERRRPRVTAVNPALGALVAGGIGALMGAVFTERDRDLADNAALGAVAGVVLGGVGSGAVTRPLSLDHSLRLALQKLGTKFVSLRHYGRYEARLLFETKSGFQVATATADSSRQWSQEDLEDWLYQQLVLGVISKLGENA